MEDMEKLPFYFFYGTHIHIGEGSYINFNCNFIDDGIITIGKRVMFGAAVTIEDNCWIGANVTICPGVKIGKNSVIGAGSVVIHDVPENTVAYI